MCFFSISFISVSGTCRSPAEPILASTQFVYECRFGHGFLECEAARVIDVAVRVTDSGVCKPFGENPRTANINTIHYNDIGTSVFSLIHVIANHGAKSINTMTAKNAAKI